MREIEFRGKRVDNNEWVFGSLCRTKSIDFIVGSGDGLLIKKGDREYLNYSYFYKVRRKTVGEYTGFNDKNGNKIFEGDMVEYNRYGTGLLRAEVKFIEICGAWWCSDMQLADLLTEQGSWMQEKYGIEGVARIIGNIHDSPELIKEER